MRLKKKHILIKNKIKQHLVQVSKDFEPLNKDILAFMVYLKLCALEVVAVHKFEITDTVSHFVEQVVNEFVFDSFTNYHKTV